ncbi:Pol protein [Phytophthora palmivora]|uniref:Pol protein n=1 Tax=Phytophthora palmivora TaxID=4796 RepID=A0A2P4Y708_9STRA|nr:Pol protein [Phytophthora palmivora]
MSLDFVFDLPPDERTAKEFQCVCHLSKINNLAPVRGKVTGKQAAQLFLYSVFRYHGLPDHSLGSRLVFSGTSCT